jgi:hypothetical protein
MAAFNQQARKSEHSSASHLDGRSAHADFAKAFNNLRQPLVRNVKGAGV